MGSEMCIRDRAWLVLGQRIGALQVAGGLLVVGTIVWMGLGPARR